MDGSRIAAVLIFLGFALIFTGFIFVVVESFIHGGVKTSGSVIIFIGPIPLAFAWGEYGFQLLLISLIIIFIMVVLLIFYRRLGRFSS